MATTSTHTDPLARLVAELDEAGRRLRQLRRASSDDAGTQLEGAQLTLLNRIVDDGPIRMSTLATELGIDKGPVSRGCARLISAGLVKRASDKEDSRASLLTATANGRRLAGKADKALAKRMSVVSSTAASTLGSQLAKLNKALGDE